MGLFKKRAAVAEPPSQEPRFDRILLAKGTRAHLAHAGSVVPLCRPDLRGKRANVPGLEMCKFCQSFADEATK